MITLKEGGQLTKFYDRYHVDRPTNLCQLFWYTLGVSAVLTALGVAAGFYLMGFVMMFISGPLHPSTILFIMVTGGAAIIGAMIYHDRHGIPNPIGVLRPQWRENISTAYDGFKEKFCPLVTYGE